MDPVFAPMAPDEVMGRHRGDSSSKVVFRTPHYSQTDTRLRQPCTVEWVDQPGGECERATRPRPVSYVALGSVTPLLGRPSLLGRSVTPFNPTTCHWEALLGHVRAFAVASEGQPRPNRLHDVRVVCTHGPKRERTGSIR